MRSTRPARRCARVLSIVTVQVLLAAMMPVMPATATAVEPEPVPTVWYVDASAETAGTGSAEDPFRSITSALAVVGEGESIEVAPGTYSEHEEFPLIISGGWYDIYSTDGAEVTIIDGDGAEGPLVWAEDAGFSLAGFTVTGAVLPEITPEIMAGGGGMAIVGCGAELSDLLITGNVASEGAGMWIGASEVYFDNVEVSENGQHSTVGLDLVSTQDSLPTDGTRYGGGISVWDSYLELSDCEISGNKADRTGAGIDTYNTVLEVYDSVISDNELSDTVFLRSASAWTDGVETQEVVGDYLDGGGVYGYLSHLDFEGTIFSGNIGNYGAVAADDCELLLIESRVEDHECFAAAGHATSAILVPNDTDGKDRMSDMPEDSEHESTVRESWSDPAVEPSRVRLRPYTVVDKTDFTGNTVETAYMGYGGEFYMLNSLMVDNDIMYPSVGLQEVYGAIMSSTVANNGGAWGLWMVGTYSDMLIDSSIIWDGADETVAVGTLGYSPSIAWSGSLYLYYDDLKSEPEYMGDDFGPQAFFDAYWLIFEDPRFMDASRGDYRLALGSPCVDANPDFGPESDHDWNMRPEDGDGDLLPAWDIGAYEYISGGRFGGVNRYDTAIQVAEENFDYADTVVIGTGERFPDGLAAAPLCGLYEAPLLLTPGAYLYSGIPVELERLHAERVIIVGGTAAVSPAVESALVDLGLDVERIGGADRYETSALIAEHVIEKSEFAGMVFVARGDRFADALTASPVAYSNLVPILLVRTDRLPNSTIEVMYDYGVTEAAIVGGSAAVDVRVEAGMQMGLGVSTERIAGADCYETSALFAQWALDQQLTTFANVGIATGRTFPDALCGGAGLGSRLGVLLLTEPDALSAPAGQVLSDQTSRVRYVQFLGLEGAISDAVRDDVYTALGW